MGYVVALPRSGVPSLDLIIATPDGQNTLAIQVKTGNPAWHPAKKDPRKSEWHWPVGGKAKELNGASLFYVFVGLDEMKEKEPTVFIVPARDVAGNLIGYPKSDPTSFWFVIMEDEAKEKWHKNDWHLIEEQLPLPKA
jgi:hypothetical protein